MSARVQNVTHTTTRSGIEEPLDTEATTTRTDRTEQTIEEAPAGSTLAARVVKYILGVIEVILAFRFALALLGANRGSDFAQFVFNLSQPFVQPFFGLFGYTPRYGASHVELFTLVAMAVYAIIAWGVISLIRLPRRGDEV
jgi:hypothetical protein